MSEGADLSLEAGISLVEMLVVLVVLALTAALGGPSLRDLLQGRRLDTTIDAIANELALLRAEALRTGQSTKLVYDPATDRFLSSRGMAHSVAISPLHAVIEVPSQSRAEPGEIRFVPGGGTTGGHIIITGRAGSRTLTVSRLTGAIRREGPMP